MIINPDKCSYMYLGKNNKNDDNFIFIEFNLKNSNKETIFGIKIDLTLTIKSTVLKLYVQK